MPPKKYRYYCLDRAGQLHNSLLFQAECDEDAIAQIAAKHPFDKCEIWNGKRLVATLDPTPMSKSIETSLNTLSHSQRLLRETAPLVAPPSRLSRGGDAR